MKKDIRIKYLELDESLYIENDEVKIIINENNIGSNTGTWDDLWTRVRSCLEKIRDYELNNTQSNSDNLKNC